MSCFTNLINYGPSYIDPNVGNLVKAQGKHDEKVHELLSHTRKAVTSVFDCHIQWQNALSLQGKTINEFSLDDLQNPDNLQNFNELNSCLQDCREGSREKQHDLVDNLITQYTAFVTQSEERFKKLKEFPNDSVANQAMGILGRKLNCLYVQTLQNVVNVRNGGDLANDWKILQ